MTRLITIDATELVLRVARATIDAQEIGVNNGAFVRRVQAYTGNKPPDAWCASFTTMCGVVALGDQWAVRKSGRVQHQCEWAQARGVRFVGRRAPAQPGDLFALWFASLGRWAHIGFVDTVAADGYTITTIEGNTSDPKNRDPARDREGWLVATKTRRLTENDRLIRWASLLDSTT
jgi:hypothetical protein